MTPDEVKYENARKLWHFFAGLSIPLTIGTIIISLSDSLGLLEWMTFVIAPIAMALLFYVEARRLRRRMTDAEGA